MIFDDSRSFVVHLVRRDLHVSKHKTLPTGIWPSQNFDIMKFWVKIPPYFEDCHLISLYIFGNTI